MPSTLTTSARREASPFIRLTDDADLVWFFGPAQAEFERSTAGGTFDAVALYSMRRDPSSPDERPEYAPAKFSRPTRPVFGMHGQVIGYEDAVTVEITAEARDEASGFTPNERSMRRYGSVSRRVHRMPVGAQQAARAYYGDVGTGYVIRPSNGAEPVKGLSRLCGLYHLTPLGQAWLARCEVRRKAKSQPDLGLRPEQVMEAEVLIALTNPENQPERVVAMRDCGAQAIAIFQGLGRAWNGTKESE